MASNRRTNPERTRRATRDEALAAMRTAWAVLKDAGALVPTTECASYHPNAAMTLRAAKSILKAWGRRWDPAEKAVTDPARRAMIADRILSALFDEHFDGGLRLTSRRAGWVRDLAQRRRPRCATGYAAGWAAASDSGGAAFPL